MKNYFGSPCFPVPLHKMRSIYVMGVTRIFLAYTFYWLAELVITPVTVSPAQIIAIYRSSNLCSITC